MVQDGLFGRGFAEAERESFNKLRNAFNSGTLSLHQRERAEARFLAFKAFEEGRFGEIPHFMAEGGVSAVRQLLHDVDSKIKGAESGGPRFKPGMDIQRLRKARAEISRALRKLGEKKK